MSQSSHNLDLVMHLCSRLCHDLAGPISAVGNGVELLAEEQDPSMQRQALDLVAESTQSAARRLKFFRLAFGAGGAFGSEMRAAEVADAAAGLFSDSRSRLDWTPAPDAILSKAEAKILLCLLMLANGALPRGGSVVVGRNAKGLTVTAKDGKVRKDAPGLEALVAPELPATIDTENAVAVLVRSLGLQYGLPVQARLSDDRLELEAGAGSPR